MKTPDLRFGLPPASRGFRLLVIWVLIALAIGACQPTTLAAAPLSAGLTASQPGGTSTPAAAAPEASATPPYPSRPRYAPGELVDYIAQSGDTLPGLAVRFNTSVAEILEANPFIPASATTMPPGMPMKIPIYYVPLWGSPYQILPDSHFINGPLQVGFDTAAFVAAQPGWLKDYTTYAAGANRTGAQVVDYIAQMYSISPRLLLALLEYRSGALSRPQGSEEDREYPLGYREPARRGLFLQLAWAANLLNSGYYRYRAQQLTTLEHRDGRIERIDPWQHADELNYILFEIRTHW